MAQTVEAKAQIVREFGKTDKDTGSPEVQIALLTSRINELTDHFKSNVNDHHGRRGLMKMVGRRRRMLDYLKRRDLDKYRQTIDRLGLRK